MAPAGRPVLGSTVSVRPEGYLGAASGRAPRFRAGSSRRYPVRRTVRCHRGETAACTPPEDRVNGRTNPRIGAPAGSVRTRCRRNYAEKRPRRRCAVFARADCALALSTATRCGFCRALRWLDFLRCLVLVGSSCPRRCPATTARSRVLARAGSASVGPGVPALVRPRRWSSGVPALYAFEHSGQARGRVVGVLDGHVEVALARRFARVDVSVDVDCSRQHFVERQMPAGQPWLGGAPGRDDLVT